eukprot:scaffold270834_cov28-Tisochrysis_lutea.AAC.4
MASCRTMLRQALGPASCSRWRVRGGRPRSALVAWRRYKRDEPRPAQPPIESASSLAQTDAADVFVLQPRSRRLEAREGARAALEEAVSLVRAIPDWKVIGEPLAPR